MTSFLRHVLDRPFNDDEIRIITIPAPTAPPETLLACEPDWPAVFWSPGAGRTMAGAGAALVVEGAGPGRFAEVAAIADRLWPRIASLVHPGVEPVPPRLFGGLSFLPDRPDGPWRPFGAAWFVLPLFLYVPGRHGARLAVVATGDQVRERGAEPIADAAESILEHLAGSQAAEGAALDDPPPRPVGPAEPADEVGWRRAVASIQERIAAGQVDKVVAARAAELAFATPIDPVTVLRRLGSSAAETRFAFRTDGATFVGAAPERLVYRRGLDVRTEALAGSAPARGEAPREELRSSPKDGEEHRLVVQAIAEALAPLCHRLDYPWEPEVRRLRHLIYLRTPFSGTLRRPVPVLDLVSRLHPTPAVGGYPAAEAMDWIAGEEGLERGWYAAPVGWFDAWGDGEFVVASRSALLYGDRAAVYAGAGIVGASDAGAELAETEAKMRRMLCALGVDS